MLCLTSHVHAGSVRISVNHVCCFTYPLPAISHPSAQACRPVPPRTRQDTSFHSTCARRKREISVYESRFTTQLVSNLLGWAFTPQRHVSPSGEGVLGQTAPGISTNFKRGLAKRQNDKRAAVLAKCNQQVSTALRRPSVLWQATRQGSWGRRDQQPCHVP